MYGMRRQTFYSLGYRLIDATGCNHMEYAELKLKVPEHKRFWEYVMPVVELSGASTGLFDPPSFNESGENSTSFVHHSKTIEFSLKLLVRSVRFVGLITLRKINI